LIESILLNFLFLLFPVLLFLLFFENRPLTSKKYFLTLMSAITMILCMTFPIRLEAGFIVDLRFIPFLIIALFLGYKYTFVLYIILNVYRFWIGVNGSVQSLLFSTIIFAVVPFLSHRAITLSPKKRITLAVSVSFCTIVLYLVTLIAFIPSLNHEYWQLSAYMLITYTSVMLINMILIEKIMANQNAREAFLQRERFAVISDLSASVSHEIRNPLTVTSGFLQLLRNSKNLGEDDKKYVDYSLLELNRAEKIVSDFLAFAKPQSENMAYSNLREEMVYVINIITPYANMYQVKIDYRFQSSLCFKYDRNQFQQCFINLFKNAIEAMKGDGGTLTIDVSEQKKAIVIRISDTGVGMSKEEVARLGRPYYSTKKEGTGLGMLMVYSTINKVDGKIRVESEKGKGTSFIITIPSR
jgi:two-component system sporulation sensor kinase B